MNVPVMLDFTDLPCPLPLVKTKAALLSLPSGALVRVSTNDNNAVLDFKLFCLATPNRLLGYYSVETHTYFWIEKGEL